MDIFDGFAFDNEDDKKDIAKVIEKFDSLAFLRGFSASLSSSPWSDIESI
jgi:hypothetical protein